MCARLARACVIYGPMAQYAHAAAKPRCAPGPERRATSRGTITRQETPMTTRLDRLDLAVLRLLAEQPRAGVREYARQLGIARGTAQARIDKLQRLGVVTSYRPQISPVSMGFTVLAYVHLHLAQGQLDDTSRLLARIPEIVEADCIAGEGDLICQV